MKYFTLKKEKKIEKFEIKKLCQHLIKFFNKQTIGRSLIKEKERNKKRKLFFI